MQPESSQPVGVVHAEAIALNDAIEGAKAASSPHSIDGKEAVAQATRETSGTQEAYLANMAEKAKVFEAEWQQEHAALLAQEEANDRKLLDGLHQLMTTAAEPEVPIAESAISVTEPVTLTMLGSTEAPAVAAVPEAPATPPTPEAPLL